jgi:catechol 2,3-dioxygenase-like lactoylglutathione lyase family enzyme
MSLGRVIPSIAVSDMAQAKDFYEGKLGLSGGDDRPDGGHEYPCSGGTAIHIYPSPDHAGKSPATLAAFETDDIEKTVAELTDKGVTFEQYGEPFNTDEMGIFDIGGQRGGWFKDPDGNILGVFETRGTGS